MLHTVSTRHDLQEMSITLRPIGPEDLKFLLDVYASTRTDEMRLLDWDKQTKEVFLHLQFEAQHRYYSENYPGAEFQVILLDGKPVGRLYIHRRESEIRIMDITVLPEHRNKGIGSFLLDQVLTLATNRQLPVTIHVEQFNPALNLYKRLGFRLVEERGVHLFMKWVPTTIPQEQRDYTR